MKLDIIVEGLEACALKRLQYANELASLAEKIRTECTVQPVDEKYACMLAKTYAAYTEDVLKQKFIGLDDREKRLLRALSICVE